jgi:aromatic-L-amino-acid decarboxylase
LWFVIRSYGVAGLKTIIREHLRLARLFAGWLDSDTRFETMAPVHLSLVCFRLNDGRPEPQLNELNTELLQKVNETGKVFLTHTALKGKTVLRMMIGQRTTTEKHVQLAWEIITEMARELLSGN